MNFSQSDEVSFLLDIKTNYVNALEALESLSEIFDRNGVKVISSGRSSKSGV